MADNKAAVTSGYSRLLVGFKKHDSYDKRYINMNEEEKEVIIIPAKEEYNKLIRPGLKRLRVAAYCRVSTSQEKQENSYEAQVAYYTEKIRKNDKWTLAGIYADDGKSATNIKKRDDFKAMLNDCMLGKIDLVITKSVSRFARNTVDSLQYIRKLKDKNIGVIVEKEGINTLENSGELLLTILSSQAQEESRNLSENTRWGIIRKFEKGYVLVNHKKFMGYIKDENCRLVIVPEEAKVVKMIFDLYLQGQSSHQICRSLEAAGIKTVTGKEKWHSSVVLNMLSNEKYMGDVLLQKTSTVDFLTKKRVINKGYVPQYFVKGNHEAIVSIDEFEQVQRERSKRNGMSYENGSVKKRYSSKYALSNVLFCGECGYPYCRVLWKKPGKVKAVWRCKNRLKNGPKACKNSPSIDEGVLHRVIVDAINDRLQKEIGIFNILEYSDSLVYLLIESVKIHESGKLEVRLKSLEWLHNSDVIKNYEL